MSDSRWRQIVQGYQLVSGSSVPVSGPPETIARMAQVVGVTPEQLEAADRTDAAKELRLLQSPEQTGPSDDLDTETLQLLLRIKKKIDADPEFKRDLAAIFQRAMRPDTDAAEPPTGDDRRTEAD